MKEKKDTIIDSNTYNLNGNRAVSVFFYVLTEEDKKLFPVIDLSFIKELSRFHQLDFSGDLRNEIIEDPSTEDNLIFIGDVDLINQWINKINPLYQPNFVDFSSQRMFQTEGGKWQDGDLIFFIFVSDKGIWKMSGGEYSSTKYFDN